MVDRTVSLGVPGGINMSVSKETFNAQLEILQKTQQELDMEREASSTAASEALSMILRLQREKAAAAMEASQYKRMAEEKMLYAETSIEFFEDLIYQKEMEIAALEFQVQAYRCKLLSLGCNDLGSWESKFQEDLMFQGNDSFFGDSENKLTRHLSLPIDLQDASASASIETKKMLIPETDGELTNSRGDKTSTSPKCDRTLMPVPDSVQNKEIIEESLAGDLASSLTKGKKLVERGKDSADLTLEVRKDKQPTPLRHDSKSRALISQLSNSIVEMTKDEIAATLEKVRNSENSSIKGSLQSSASSSFSAKYIFEVMPSTEKKDELGGEPSYDPKTPGDSKTPSDPKTPGDLKTSNKIFLEKKLAKPPRDLAKIQSRERLLEGERKNLRREMRKGGREEEMKLLKEIKEQLNLIQAEMKSATTIKKCPPPSDSVFIPLREAMMQFWL